jgi:predicted nuclease with TOPRIM domain
MASKNDLHDRLDQLEQRLNATKEKLVFKKALHDGHKLTSGELLVRYRYLRDQLEGEIADLSEHGHRVTALEQDALNWINSIDLDNV